MSDVGIDAFVADEGRGEIEDDAVVGEGRGDRKYVRSWPHGRRLAAGLVPAQPDLEIDDPPCFHAFTVARV